MIYLSAGSKVVAFHAADLFVGIFLGVLLGIAIARTFQQIYRHGWSGFWGN
jgi:hypothetical protein